MQLAALIITTAIMVPPNEPVVDHSQPYHYTQPTIRTFERRDEDDARRSNWDSYTRELDDLWREYREAGSTVRAWQRYQREAYQAKRRFIWNDPYYAPIIRNVDEY